MMNTKKMFAAALTAVGMTASLTCVSATEPVGSFARIEGSAVVSQGAQYVKAYEGMPLNAGDRLMVMDGGKAILSFKDGCQYTLGDNELLTIGATSACASRGAGSYKVDPRSAVSQGAAKTPVTLQPAAVGGGVGGALGGMGTAGGAVVAGAVGVVAVAGATASTGSDSNDNKAQPSP